MPEQLEMPLRSGVPLDPEVSDLEAFLRGRCWLSADQISGLTGWTDRRIRRLASMSDLIVSAPGRPGYCHIGDITRDDYERCRAAMRSQSRQMIGRIVRWDRHYFRRMPLP